MIIAPFWNFVLCTIFVIFGIYAGTIPKTSFSCDGRTSGYYADTSTGCQIYHMCDGLGRQFSYKCPSKTLFQQRMLICDHWYMVNCSKAEEDYSANLLIGQRERAFVDDPQFRRTPRPDLKDPGNSNFNTYRIGNQETLATKNVVGADDNDDTSTDESNYFPPSHWSTEVPSEITTLPNVVEETENKNVTSEFTKQIFVKTSYNHSGKKNHIGNFRVTEDKLKRIEEPERILKRTKPKEENTVLPGFVKQIFYKTSYNTVDKNLNRAKGSVFNSANRNNNAFESDYKIIIPKDTITNKDDQDNRNNQASPVNNKKENTFLSGVNFPSTFKATTPVYPSHVDVDSSKFNDFEDPLQQKREEEISVNFPSNFKATTPVYPKRVDTDPSKISEFDIPVEQKKSDLEIVIVNFPSNFKATTPVYPKHVDVDPSKLSEFDVSPKEEENNEFVSVNFPSNFKATTPVYPAQVFINPFELSEFDKPIEQEKTGIVSVVYPSKFKATTPVYPKDVGVDLSKFSEPVELPLEEKLGNINVVNFPSSNKATTPVYPNTVESTSPNPDEVGLLPPFVTSPGNNSQSADHVHVNFASNFQATTPNYPKSVEPTSPDPSYVGLALPKEVDEDIPAISTDIRPPKFEKTFSRRSDEYDPTVVGNTFSSKQLTEFMLTMRPEQLRDLKELWHIPDYDFPLDTPARPSYNSDYSSFEAKPINKS